MQNEDETTLKSKDLVAESQIIKVQSDDQNKAALLEQEKKQRED